MALYPNDTAKPVPSVNGDSQYYRVTPCMVIHDHYLIGYLPNRKATHKHICHSHPRHARRRSKCLRY